MNLSKIEKGVEFILQGLGVDLRDPNYADTPERVARFYAEMFSPKTTEWAVFPENYTDFVMLRRHVLHTLCPHHLLPVELEVSLAYIPEGNVLGLSKLARLLDECNNGPILQERFTRDVVRETLLVLRGARGCACLVKGKHDCARIRGVHTSGDFTTYHLEGEFRTDENLANRFFSLASSSKG